LDFARNLITFSPPTRETLKLVLFSPAPPPPQPFQLFYCRRLIVTIFCRVYVSVCLSEVRLEIPLCGGSLCAGRKFTIISKSDGLYARLTVAEKKVEKQKA